MHKNVLCLVALTGLAIFSLIGATSVAAAEARDATAAEAGWFAGTWDATKGVAGDGELLIAGAAKRVVIRHLGAAQIERDWPVAQDRVATTQYTVRSFGKNWPWWNDGGNQVAKRVDENTFHLAQIGAMGRADWANAWVYVRVQSVEASPKIEK